MLLTRNNVFHVMRGSMNQNKEAKEIQVIVMFVQDNYITVKSIIKLAKILGIKNQNP